jgi:hypothetical protein
MEKNAINIIINITDLIFGVIIKIVKRALTIFMTMIIGDMEMIVNSYMVFAKVIKELFV